MPIFGETRPDSNNSSELQSWDGANWMSTSEFKNKYGIATTNSTSITDKQFNRSYNTGDYAITGQSSNGINITKDGNIFQYTGNNKEFLDNLNKAGANLALNPNDPNNIGSFIGMFVTGDTDIKLGSTNQQTLNKNQDPPKDVVTADKKVEQKPGKGILIGDSFCPSVKKNSKSLQPLTDEGVLWKVGINVKVLNDMVSAYKVDDTITHVFISIGSNDTYLEVKKGITKTLVNTLHTKFPKASLYVFKGDYDSKNVYDPLHDGGYDWFNNKIDKIIPRRDNYYATFWTPLGVTVMKNDVGDVQKHAGPSTPGIIAIGHEIDSILGNNVVTMPTQEIRSTYTPKTVKKAEAITVKKDEEEADIMQEEYDSLPSDEGVQIFEVIRVDRNLQDNVPQKKSPSLIGDSKIIEQLESNNSGKVPKDGGNFTKYGSQFKLIQNDGTLGNQYYYPCALFNQGDPQWGGLTSDLNMRHYGCCYNSYCMLVTNKKNNAGYTPKYMWDNAEKGKFVTVHWPNLSRYLSLNYNLMVTSRVSLIDERLKKGPIMFEWDNKNKASKTSYAGRYTKRHHWMVINGMNTDGTYTVFDPSGGRIWKNQPKEAISAGLIRVCYFD